MSDLAFEPFGYLVTPIVPISWVQFVTQFYCLFLGPAIWPLVNGFLQLAMSGTVYGTVCICLHLSLCSTLLLRCISEEFWLG